MQRLAEVEQITQKFAAGQLDARLPASDIPELNRLGVSFNRMAASLEGVEQRRRELIGDLTHELRTPLTVVRGYLEELADGGIEPSPEILSAAGKRNQALRAVGQCIYKNSQRQKPVICRLIYSRLIYVPY